jgi:hypothetical protein
MSKIGLGFNAISLRTHHNQCETLFPAEILTSAISQCLLLILIPLFIFIIYMCGTEYGIAFPILQHRMDIEKNINNLSGLYCMFVGKSGE